MAADAPSQATHAASPQASRRLVGVAQKIAAILGLFALGLVVGWATKGKPVDPDDTSKAASDGKHVAGAAESPRIRGESEVAAALHRGRELLQEGRWQQALGTFQKLADESKGAVPGPLALRLAQCHEELGQWNNALQMLQLAMAQGSATQAQVAQLGQARVQLRRQQSAAAQALLWPIVLRAGNFGPTTPAVVEAEYLLALALAQESMPKKKHESLEPMNLPPLGMEWDLERPYAWLTQPSPKAEKEPRSGITARQNPGQAGAELVDVAVNAMPAREAIEKLASAAQRKVVWSAEATHLVQHRTVTLALSARPWSSVLQDAAATLGLACNVTANQVQVTTVAEIPVAARAEQRRAHATGRLQAAIQAHPDHVLAPAALLALGHLDAAGKSEPAEGPYQQLIQKAPRSRLAVNAAFHQGVWLRRAGRLPEAQQWLFRVVDQAPGHPLTPPALLHIGQMYLEQGDWRQARSLLHRAESQGGKSSTRSAIVLTLAAATVLSDEPREAVPLLVKNQDLWPDEATKHMAGFLAAYARYRHALGSGKSARQANELTIGLLRVPSDSVLGALAQRMQAAAFRDLGMWQQVVEVCEKASGRVQGPLADELTFRLGEAQVRLQKDQDARRALTAVVDTKGNWSAWARFELAGLELQQNRLDQCMVHCQWLLQSTHAVPIREVLALMGRAYERQGKFAVAAKCFAGEVPEP